MLLRCLPRNVDASCHILRRPLPPSAKSATVSSTRHGPSRLSVLHLPLQLLTARDGATYWLRIAISVYPTYIRRPRFGESPSEYCHNVWKKNYNGVATRWWKKFEDILIRFDRVHERDGQTHRQTDTAWWHKPRLHIIARQKLSTETKILKAMLKKKLCVNYGKLRISLLLVCVSWAITGQPRNSVFIRRV